eukprot:4349023-Prymnesium_polylepis.1
MAPLPKAQSAALVDLAPPSTGGAVNTLRRTVCTWDNGQVKGAHGTLCTTQCGRRASRSAGRGGGAWARRATSARR